MPKLPNSTNAAIPTNLLLGGEVALAMQTLTEPIRQMNEAIEKLVEPIRQAQEVMESMILPIKIMQDALNTSMLPMIKAMETYTETHRRMLQSVSLFGLDNINRVGMDMNIKASVIDGEIMEGKDSQQPLLTQHVVAVPSSQALVPLIPARPSYEAKSIMGLKEIAGRSFQYKRKTLKKLSFRNCEGRLLSLFLLSRDLFVSDTDIYEKLHISDGRSFSWVLRNLKRKFRANGLSVTIERRWDPDGYILIDIFYLQ